MTTLSQPYRPKPYVLDRETAPAFWLVGTLFLPLATGLQTGNLYSLIEQRMPQGPGPASHCHPYDEGFFILEGELTFHGEGNFVTLGAGGFLHIPRFCEHTFTVDSATAHVLNYYTPAGSELIVMSLGQPAPSRTLPSMDAVPMPAPAQVKILGELFGSIPGGGIPFVDKPDAANMGTTRAPWTPVPLLSGLMREKPARTLFGQQWKVLADSAQTGGTYALCEVGTATGFQTEPQRNGHDQGLYLLAGRAELTLDGTVHGLKEGAFAYLPAGTSHSFRALEATQALCFLLPGGFERAVADFGTTADAAQTAPAAGLDKFLEEVGTSFVGAAAVPTHERGGVVEAG